eukprot:TRINITY_DN7626_c0_g1_i2.p1 TRINITY_DN7626_c0_g1~~TRINITY_DN7626_c0_g1_i2.p1  ORF type:complete len:181 (-),score=45.09 TRINITY_DN7626_c0_g1_i2:43-546(-)
MADTKEWRLHHTMLRVKDPKKSHEFYSGLLGLTLVYKADFDWGKFSLYFYTYLGDQKKPEFKNDNEAIGYIFSNRSHSLELTHNWGTENNPDFKYNNGNEEPKGFGHIAIVVPDIDAAFAKFEAAGTKIIKRPEGGKMQGIAFVADPDGYWVEIIPHGWDGNYVKKA